MGVGVVQLRKKQPKPVDLSDVIDFKSISESYHGNGELPSGIFAIPCDFDTPVFCLESHPGMPYPIIAQFAFYLQLGNY